MNSVIFIENMTVGTDSFPNFHDFSDILISLDFFDFGHTLTMHNLNDWSGQGIV